LPPSCNATECSAVSKSRCRGTSPCSNAPVVIISVYRRALGASKRWKYRQCRSVTSIMGATHRRQPDGSGVDFETANVWDRGGVLMKIRRKRQYNRSFSHGSAGWTKIQRLPHVEASPDKPRLVPIRPYPRHLPERRNYTHPWPYSPPSAMTTPAHFCNIIRWESWYPCEVSRQASRIPITS